MPYLSNVTKTPVIAELVTLTAKHIGFSVEYRDHSKYPLVSRLIAVVFLTVFWPVWLIAIQMAFDGLIRKYVASLA